jgi:hypothetical protein
MATLSDGDGDVASRFRRDGATFPIRVMTEADAAACLRELEEGEARGLPKSTLDRCLNGYALLALPFVGRLAKAGSGVRGFTGAL